METHRRKTLKDVLQLHARMLGKKKSMQNIQLLIKHDSFIQYSLTIINRQQQVHKKGTWQRALCSKETDIMISEKAL